ncbi:MAG: AhpC/TSA family protein [Phycisphaerales bacterium]|nr:AhpC/TSA family protein [Phycisphaerales bacterium]
MDSMMMFASMAVAAAAMSGGPCCQNGTTATGDGSVQRVAMTEPILGLQVGEEVPAGLTLSARDGSSVDFASLHEERPLVVTFYRGGWCPYCNVALKGWQEHAAAFKDAGYDLVFVTMESPDLATQTFEKNRIEAPVYCDKTGDFAKAFNVLFDVDAKTQEQYAQYGIDVAASNSNGKWQLPHPGTFIVSTDGKVTWAHCMADYAKGRADPGDVLTAIKGMSH